MIIIRAQNSSVYLVSTPAAFSVEDMEDDHAVCLSAPTDNRTSILFEGTKEECEDILNDIWVEVEDGAVIDIANLVIDKQAEARIPIAEG